MSFVSPGSEYDFMLGVLLIVFLLIGCGLSFGILSSLLINDRKKGCFFTVVVALWIISSLIVLFKNYTFLGIAALVIFIIFTIATYIFVKKKKSES